MRVWTGSFSLLIFLWLFSLHASVAPLVAYQRPVTMAATPIQAIKDLDQMIDSYRVGKDLTEEDKQYNRELKSRILRGTFDLHELAKLSLDEYWSTISALQQEQFVELLTQLLEERSIFAKEKAKERGEERSYVIAYHGQDYKGKDKSEALARTTVDLKKKSVKIELNYKLRRTQFGWKIFDVIMDDASLVVNYRHSFGKIIKKHGYPELVHRMEKKLKEFREKREKTA